MSTLIETLAVLEPITMMLAIFALIWVLLPLIARQPAWLRVLLALYPAVYQVNRAISDPTLWNIGMAIVLGAVPFVVIAKPRWPVDTREPNRAPRDTGVPE
jgi:hypothetical protein